MFPKELDGSDFSRGINLYDSLKNLYEKNQDGDVDDKHFRKYKSKLIQYLLDKYSGKSLNTDILNIEDIEYFRMKAKGDYQLILDTLKILTQKSMTIKNENILDVIHVKKVNSGKNYELIKHGNKKVKDKFVEEFIDVDLNTDSIFKNIQNALRGNGLDPNYQNQLIFRMENLYKRLNDTPIIDQFPENDKILPIDENKIIRKEIENNYEMLINLMILKYQNLDIDKLEIDHDEIPLKSLIMRKYSHGYDRSVALGNSNIDELSSDVFRISPDNIIDFLEKNEIMDDYIFYPL